MICVLFVSQERMKRYEAIGNFWCERVAGATQADAEEREEQQTLRAARRQEAGKRKDTVRIVALTPKQQPSNPGTTTRSPQHPAPFVDALMSRKKYPATCKWTKRAATN